MSTKKQSGSRKSESGVSPRKVAVKDLNLKSRQLRVRGGGKTMGRIGRAVNTSLTSSQLQLSPAQLESLQ